MTLLDQMEGWGHCNQETVHELFCPHKLERFGMFAFSNRKFRGIYALASICTLRGNIRVKNIYSNMHLALASRFTHAVELLQQLCNLRELRVVIRSDAHLSSLRVTVSHVL